MRTVRMRADAKVAVVVALWVGLATGGVAVAADPDADTLAEARQGFVTKPRASSYKADGAVPEPPANTYVKMKYKSPAGELVALLTADPKDGKRRPAVLWCHGGSGGIGPYYWTAHPAGNDQTPKAFVDAGFVVMIPSWRGENDNPGRYEMFLGEVDDAAAAVDHLAGLPYVDPKRVYVVGHSNGGTIAVLLALSPGAADKVRAVFALGPAMNLGALREAWANDMPFDPADARELRARSPIHFVASLKTPTWCIEGLDSGHVAEIRRSGAMAAQAKTPLTVAVIKGADHFSIVRPVTTYLAAVLRDDTGPKLPAIQERALQRAFEDPVAGIPAAKPVRPAVAGPFKLSAAALAEWKRVAERDKVDLGTHWLVIGAGTMQFARDVDEKRHAVHTQDGLRIALPMERWVVMRGRVMDFAPRNGGPPAFFTRAATPEEAAAGGGSQPAGGTR